MRRSMNSLAGSLAVSQLNKLISELRYSIAFRLRRWYFLRFFFRLVWCRRLSRPRFFDETFVVNGYVYNSHISSVTYSISNAMRAHTFESCDNIDLNRLIEFIWPFWIDTFIGFGNWNQRDTLFRSINRSGKGSPSMGSVLAWVTIVLCDTSLLRLARTHRNNMLHHWIVRSILSLHTHQLSTTILHDSRIQIFQ